MSSSDDSAPPQQPAFVSGVSTLFSSAALTIAAPPRSHRRTRAADAAAPLVASASYSQAVSTMQRDAVAAIHDMAVRGELLVGT